jgi:hypothetical protein
MKPVPVRSPGSGTRTRTGTGTGTGTIGAVIAIAMMACSAGPPGPGLPIDRVLDHTRVLSESIGPRRGGTDGARRAAAYIEAELAAAGATVERRAVGIVDVPGIAIGPLRVRPPFRHEGRDDNLVARFGPAEGQALVFLAHYDTVPNVPGAADNAASVGLLLELARELAAHPPPAPVWLAFTADEEVGLVGAHRLADELGDRVGFAIALDLVGLDGPLVVNGAGELIRGDELRWLAGAADVAGVDLASPWPHRIVSRWWPQAERADHGAFTNRGIRAVHLFHRGGSSGERIYLAYHTPRDRVDQLSPGALAEGARLVRALAARPPPPPSSSSSDLGVWLPLPGNRVVPRWTLIVACGLLLGAAVFGLVRIRRQLIPGPGLVAAIAVWVAAAATTYAVERLTARGYPAPWVHAPVRHELGVALVLAGVATLIVVGVARWRPWAGPARFAAAAAVWNLLIGAFLVVIQAAELAWLWLAPAALLAWAPRLAEGRGRIVAAIAVVLALVPTLPLVAPGLLRELYFHGFLPESVPVTALVALHGITAALALAHLASQVRSWGPGLTFAVPAAAVVAIAIGTLALATYEPPCEGGELPLRKLACEVGG